MEITVVLNLRIPVRYEVTLGCSERNEPCIFCRKLRRNFELFPDVRAVAVLRHTEDPLPTLRVSLRVILDSHRRVRLRQWIRVVGVAVIVLVFGHSDHRLLNFTGCPFEQWSRMSQRFWQKKSASGFWSSQSIISNVSIFSIIPSAQANAPSKSDF